MKYIVYEDEHYLEQMIIFSNMIEHGQIKINMRIPDDKVVSAGEVYIDSDTCHCYGNSLSLTNLLNRPIRSREEDTELFRRLAERF